MGVYRDLLTLGASLKWLEDQFWTTSHLMKGTVFGTSTLALFAHLSVSVTVVRFSNFTYYWIYSKKIFILSIPLLCSDVLLFWHRSTAFSLCCVHLVRKISGFKE